MKKPLTGTQIVTQEFMQRFSLWDIPIENLDVTLSKLPNEQRQSHYLEVKEWSSKDSFKREIADWLRRISRRLARGVDDVGNPLSDLQLQGLRQTMIEVENAVRVWEQRATLAAPIKSLRSISEKV